MKTFLNEFKEFINRGNVMDLAVGVIIGGAFTSIVTALTDHIINPLIAVVAGGGTDNISGLVIPGTDIDFGAFISAIINFLIVAFVVFLLVKGINKVQDASGKILKKDNGETVVEEPPTCPFCKEEVKEAPRAARIALRSCRRRPCRSKRRSPKPSTLALAVTT